MVYRRKRMDTESNYTHLGGAESILRVVTKKSVHSRKLINYAFRNEIVLFFIQN